MAFQKTKTGIKAGEFTVTASGSGKPLNLHAVMLAFSGDFLSDLFFNYRNDEYDALFKDGNGASPEEIEIAIRKDAQAFVSRLPTSQREAYPDLAQALAADFMKRL